MPNLIVIAGCNGAGKSTFASSFLPDRLTSFDYDKLYLEYYGILPDSEFRDKFARDKTTKDFEDAIKQSIANKTDFCYETNFDTSPVYWPEQFKKHGFTLHLIFFCLDNQEIARRRVEERVEFKGHYVDSQTIDFKWKAGYKNLNEHHTFFDNILLVDNSVQKEVYSNLLQIEHGEIVMMVDKLPDYFKRRFPDIYTKIEQ
ncbi:MAG: zeta toxin family protein [Flavobacteriaceae bacterium]